MSNHQSPDHQIVCLTLAPHPGDDWCLNALVIRPYDAARDADGFRVCLVEQQDFHRAIESTWPEGRTIVDEYIVYLEQQCAEHDGCVFVAESDREIVGFVCVLAAAPATPDDPTRHAWVQDIVVRPSAQRRGIATRLMTEAESFAHGRGVRVMRLGVLEGNEGARAFYRRRGFRDYLRVLTRTIG
jgi:ribosomal protein S18 acetylase RimI-like enzyme